MEENRGGLTGSGPTGDVTEVAVQVARQVAVVPSVDREGSLGADAAGAR